MQTTKIQATIARFVGATLAAAMLMAPALETAAAPITFPDNGTQQTVNVIRRYNDGSPLFSVTQILGGGLGSAPFMNVFDGGHSSAQWNGVTSAAHSVTFQITLDDIYPLRTFRADYDSTWRPDGGYDISVSTTGFGSLTSVASSSSAPATLQIDTLGSAVNAQYIQYTWFGPTTNNVAPHAVIFREFQAFADASAGLQSYDPSGSFNVVAIQGNGPIAISKLTPTTWQADNENNVVDLNIDSYLRGNGTGDAQFLLDLGSVHMIESIGLGFFSGQSWGSGIRIEGSLDNVNFVTLHDQSTSVSSMHVNNPDWAARYLRVTNKGGASGALTEFEVYAGPLPVLAEMPLSGSTIDFESVFEFSSKTLADAITLTNTGELTSVLQVLSFSITGPDADIFDLPDFVPAALIAGGDDTVMFDLVALVGEEGNTYNALLTIATNVGDITFNLQAASFIPEPASGTLLGLASLGLIGIRRRRRTRDERGRPTAKAAV